jgi:pilus assembly protein TadC
MLAVKYLLGHSFWKRYWHLFAFTVGSALLAVVYAFFFIDANVSDILFYLLFFGMIEFAFNIIFIRVQERKNTISHLKQ